MDRCSKLDFLFHGTLLICCGWQRSLYMTLDAQLVMGGDGHLPVWYQTGTSLVDETYFETLV